MNAEELSKDFKPEAFTNHMLPENWNELSVAGLNFSYPDAQGEVLHLDNVSLVMRRGEKIAVIGNSGGGKTTYLNIMGDVYQPKAEN